MLPKQGSGDQIAEVLQQGGTLALLGDQHAGRGACWVDFFGKPASTHKAVSVFTLGSSAPTAVSASFRRGDEPLVFDMQVASIVDPTDSDFPYGTIPLLTEWYTRHLEGLIRSRPEQYWWVHRRWKGEPTSREARRLAKTKQLPAA
jgi:KDO2-lipid IV(A) lauroyltransferase